MQLVDIVRFGGLILLSSCIFVNSSLSEPKRPCQREQVDELGQINSHIFRVHVHSYGADYVRHPRRSCWIVVDYEKPDIHNWFKEKKRILVLRGRDEDLRIKLDVTFRVIEQFDYRAEITKIY